MISPTAGVTTGSSALLSSMQKVHSGAADMGEQQLEAVGKEMEGVFLSMLLKEMRNSLEDGFFGKEGSDTYGGMFDLFIGQHLAESKPLGLSDTLLNQYTKNQGNAGRPLAEEQPVAQSSESPAIENRTSSTSVVA
ncbi:MAG: rod-binding protein [Planctomycetota bacterium]